jgi:hypothetical protein
MAGCHRRQNTFHAHTACPLLKVAEPGSLCHVSQLLASAANHAVTSHPAHHGNSMLPLEIILVLIGVVIGRLWGRRTGLKHLGEVEFRTRWNGVRKIRRW